MLCLAVKTKSYNFYNSIRELLSSALIFFNHEDVWRYSRCIWQNYSTSYRGNVHGCMYFTWRWPQSTVHHTSDHIWAVYQLHLQISIIALHYISSYSVAYYRYPTIFHVHFNMNKELLHLNITKQYHINKLQSWQIRSVFQHLSLHCKYLDGQTLLVFHLVLPSEIHEKEIEYSSCLKPDPKLLSLTFLLLYY